MLKRIVRGMNGFTLIELLAVMAIVAVLAGIIAVAVSGSGGTSRDTQTVQDGTTAESSVADFFSDQTGAEFLTTKGDDVLGVAITSAATGEEISDQWPEDFLTDTYSVEFPVDTSNIKSVTLLDKDGNQERDGGVLDLVHGFTAIDFSDLDTGGYTSDIPDRFTAVSTATTGTTSTDFHDYLWLFEKDTAAASTGQVGARNVAIYRLLTVSIDSGTRYELIYRRIF